MKISMENLYVDSGAKRFGLVQRRMLREEHKTGHYPNIIPDQNL